MKKMKLKILLMVALLSNALPINGLFVSKINKNPRTFVGGELISIPTPTSVPRPIVSSKVQPGTPNMDEATMRIKNLARESNVSSQQIKQGNIFSGKQSSGFLNWLISKISPMLPKKKTSTVVTSSNFSGSAAKPGERRGYSSSAKQSQEAVSASERSFWSFIPGTKEHKIEALYDELMAKKCAISFGAFRDLKELIESTGYNPLNRYVQGMPSALALAIERFINSDYSEPSNLLYGLGARLQSGEEERILDMAYRLKIKNIDKFTYDNRVDEVMRVIPDIINVYSYLKSLGLDIDSFFEKKSLNINKFKELADIYGYLRRGEDFIGTTNRKGIFSGDTLLGFYDITSEPIRVFLHDVPYDNRGGYNKSFLDYINSLKHNDKLIKLLNEAGFFFGNFQYKSNQENVKDMSASEQVKLAKDKLITLLGLSFDASEKEIKDAVNKYRKSNHPDLTPHNLSPKEREKEKEIRNAATSSLNVLYGRYTKALQREKEITK